MLERDTGDARDRGSAGGSDQGAYRVRRPPLAALRGLAAHGALVSAETLAALPPGHPNPALLGVFLVVRAKGRFRFRLPSSIARRLSFRPVLLCMIGDLGVIDDHARIPSP
jgi:hypothetical protein